MSEIERGLSLLSGLCRVASSVDSITGYIGFYCLSSCHVAPLASGVDTVLVDILE